MSRFALACLATLLLLAADNPLEGDKFLQKADEKFDQAAGRAHDAYAKAMGEALDTKLKTYRGILAAATKAGDFERAAAVKARVDEMETESEGFKRAPTKPSTHNKIQILSATYGINQSWLDVTNKLTEKAHGKLQWSTVVSDSDWGDPAPGYEIGNTLVVRYSWNGKTAMKSVYEGRELTLP